MDFIPSLMWNPTEKPPCQEHSECPSAQKGGAMCGDLGFLAAAYGASQGLPFEMFSYSSPLVWLLGSGFPSFFLSVVPNSCLLKASAFKQQRCPVYLIRDGSEC